MDKTNIHMHELPSCMKIFRPDGLLHFAFKASGCAFNRPALASASFFF